MEKAKRMQGTDEKTLGDIEERGPYGLKLNGLARMMVNICSSYYFALDINKKYT